MLGLAIALARTSRVPALAPLRLLGAVFVDVLRGVPTILVVYLIGFGLPALELSGVPDDPVLLGGAALALSYSAYVAEVYRAGIHSVHPSQRAAALAVGLTGPQAMRHVVLPQAVRRVVPPLLNDFISLQKDVALVSILGPLEAFRVAQIEASSNFEYTPLVAAALLYLCVTIPLARVGLTVLDNVVLAPVRAHGIPRAEATARARELLARFGLQGREDHLPDRLSGGQQQRVAIVRALATGPRALLLDEITSALDPELVGDVLDVVRELKGEGMTMLIATHEMSFAREVADEVCFLHDGAIVERGAPEEVLVAPRRPETQRFLRRLVDAGRL